PVLGESAAAKSETTESAAVESAEQHVHMGFMFKRAGRIDEAQAEFEKAAALDPHRAMAFYMLGLIYEKKGLRDKAMQAWQACLANARHPEMREKARNHLHLLSTTRP
ncbi:MAG: tetratricopeptide repeat protein, partial [Elusimicrobia bacterium]|nr:tetratricopeptide repeat protein [Elusimicrobiota bacterium]